MDPWKRKLPVGAAPRDPKRGPSRQAAGVVRIRALDERLTRLPRRPAASKTYYARKAL